MKKINEKKRFLRRLALLLPLMLLAGIAAWKVAAQRHEQSAENALSMAARREVKNVSCTGSCDNILLVSDQVPDVQYFAAGTHPTCIEANIWANETREEQITVSGYVFYQGVQETVPPQTFSTEVLDGRDLEFTLPRFSARIEHPANVDIIPDPTFVMHLKETGQWNQLESLTCKTSCSSSQDNFTIVTDKNGGRVTLFDHCTAEEKATVIYALYQAPELHGPDDDDTYRVSVGLRALPSTGSTSGWVDGAGFERVYASSELGDDTLHIIADVGEATFEFDLVKDAE